MGVRAGVLIGSLAAALCWTVGAQAETAHDTAHAQAETGAAAAPAQVASVASPPAATQLKAIEVTDASPGPHYAAPITSTATGTRTPRLDVPLTISVIPDTVLRDQGAASLSQAVRNAPGVYVQQGEGNRDEFYLRGVKTKSDFFVDGLRDDTEYFRPLYNVAHVDVLQGPAALLFGRGTAGGVINLVTKKPEHRSIRHFSFRGGSFNRMQATADVGGALGEHGAYRVMAMGENSDGFRNNAFLHRYAFNPKLRYNFGPDTELDLSFSWLHDRRLADRGIPSRNGRPVDVDRDTFFGSPDQNVAWTHIMTGSMRLKHRFNDHLRVRNAFLVSRTNRRYTNAYPGSAVNAAGQFQLQAYDHPSSQLSYLERAELVADFETGFLKHKVLGGIEYSWQYGSDVEYTPGPSKTLMDASNNPRQFTLARPTVSNIAFPFLERSNHLSDNELGVFLQDQISLGEHWKALAGVRWDRYSVTGDYFKSGQHSDSTHYHWSPRVGLIYKPVENDSIYVSVSESFTPQGARLLNLQDPSDAKVGPSKAINYEVGNKLKLFDGRFYLTAAIFQLELKDQVSNAPDGSGRLVNTGRQRNRGIELSAQGSLTDKLSVFANYTYLDARITEATTGAQPGDRVGLVPYNQFSVWTRYALTPHWGFGVGIHGADRKYTSFDNDVKLPGFVTGSAMVYYKLQRYRLQLNIDNITDVTYYPTANGDNQIMPGAPINVMLNFSVNL